MLLAALEPSAAMLPAVRMLESSAVVRFEAVLRKRKAPRGPGRPSEKAPLEAPTMYSGLVVMSG